MALLEHGRKRSAQWLLAAFALVLVGTAAAVLVVSMRNVASTSSIRLEAQRDLMITDMVSAVQIEAELVGTFAGQAAGMEMGEGGLGMESMAGDPEMESMAGDPEMDMSDAVATLGDHPEMLAAVTEFEQATESLGELIASSDEPALNGVATAHRDFIASIATLDARAHAGEDVMSFYHGNTQLLESALRGRLHELQSASNLRLQRSIDETTSTENLLRWTIPLLLIGGIVAAGYLLRLHTARQRIETLEHLVEVKGEFVAAVSHELRTPLTAIVGFADVLRKSEVVLSPSDRLEMIAAISEQSADVTAIIEDLLVAARDDIGGVAVVSVPVDLRAQTAQILETLSLSSTIDVVGQASTTLGDPARVRQILRNLLSNATRYGGDLISVELSSYNDALASLIVKDNGPPIPVKDQTRIFEPYQRAVDREHPGSIGLGLAVSRQLARLMGGDLTYRHQDGYSVFELSLPVAVPTDLEDHQPTATATL